METREGIEACLEDIKDWTERNVVKFYDNKTKLMFCIPKDLEKLKGWMEDVNKAMVLRSVSAETSETSEASSDALRETAFCKCTSVCR